jgi:CRP-like cAMP-binding protein
MPKAQRFQTPGENRLLAALPKKEAARLQPLLERMPFGLRGIVYERDQPISHVLFPTSGVYSLVIEMRNGGAVEVGTIGNEGLVGTPVFLGAGRSPIRAFCQVPGEALRMTADDFRREAVGRSGPLQELVRRYTQALVTQISQTVACNHLHSVQERMCRWLLMTHDRVGADEFLLTQEFLAQMLGVRRPSVSVVAGLLFQSGLIRYVRGRMTIRNRKGLEKEACECYQIVRDEMDRLLDPTVTNNGSGAPR